MKRHIWIPDTQLRPGVPTEHIKWASEAIVDYKPDVIVIAGDWHDMTSLNGHTKPGSLEKEGTRIRDDIAFGNEQFKILTLPMYAEMERTKRNKKRAWDPEREFLLGNHEHRISRAISENPQLEGMIRLDMLDHQDFKTRPFLEIVDIDGISYSHYFSNVHSGRAIGGSIDNRLNRIGNSFVQGHQQGFLYGVRQLPGNLTRHGLVAGSFYLHDEPYRDVQSNGEWRGIVILNEVKDGGYDIMPLSMDYLRRRYG